MAVAVIYPHHFHLAEIEIASHILGLMGVDHNTISWEAFDMHVSNAYKAIRNYLRLEADADVSEHMTAAVDLAIAYYSNYHLKLNKLIGKRSVTQQTQGSRSCTFASAEIEVDKNGMTDSVKAILPPPPVRVF